MREIVAVLLVVAIPSAASADEWWARDKALHFGASAILAGGGYGLSSLFFEETEARLASGASLALAAGVGKEIYDAAGNGDASWKDFAWDVAGTGVGLLVAWGIDRLVAGEGEARPASGGVSFRF